MGGALRASSTSILLFFFFIIFLYFSGSSAMHGSKKLPDKPCNELKFFFHDILYNGNNAVNATSAIVAAPQGSNLTALAPLNHFGDIVVFDDPVTLDANLHSPPIGRVQGMYLYDRKDFFTAWFGMTFVFNTTEHQGTISVMGADPALKTRDVSVVGGTGDFIMARGIASIKTDAIEGEVYFRLQIHMKLYDCWY